MRRAHLAIVMSLCWAVALGASIYGWLSFSTLAAAVATFAAGAIATVLSYMLGMMADGRAAERVAAAATAIGPSAQMTDQAVVARMAQRLEGASAVEAAFSEMPVPVLIADAAGTILAASRGLVDLCPGAAAGQTIDAVYGDGFLAGGGGPAEESLVAIEGRRYDARRRNIGGGRALISLTPAGIYIADDDLDAFSTAIADGRTAFRFSEGNAQANPALAACNTSLAALDRAAGLVGKLLAGTPPQPQELEGSGALALRVRLLAGEMARLRADATAARAAQKSAEDKVAELVDTVEAHRASATALAEVVEHGGAAAGKASARRRKLSTSEPVTADSDAGEGVRTLKLVEDSTAPDSDADAARDENDGTPAQAVGEVAEVDAAEGSRKQRSRRRAGHAGTAVKDRVDAGGY